MGTPFMPWQNKAARLIGELTSDGLPRWRTVIVTVPRQSGKSSVAKASTHAKAMRLPGAEMYGTAQTRLYAVRHLEKLSRALGPRVKSRLGVGAERISWPNGSQYEVIAPTDSGGHGDSIDWMLIDEGWKLERAVLGGIRPAMAARPHSQMLIISTMGTVDSEVWNELVEMGRESVDDPSSEIAYLEYSAPSEEAVFDERKWGEWMPALGHTLGKAHIRADMKILSPSDFVRAYGNLTVQSLAIVFPEEWWGRQMVSAVEPSDRMVLGIDVNDDPSGASITSGHLTTEGAVVTRLLEWRFGSPKWVITTLAQMTERRNVEAIVGDFGGPSRALLTEISNLCEARGVPMVDRKPRDLGADTVNFHDALREGSVFIERNEHLEAALRGAYRKNIGDLWVPHRRRMAVDPTPLLSTIMAFGMAREFALTPRLPAIW
jgi:hypothetical protein